MTEGQGITTVEIDKNVWEGFFHFPLGDGIYRGHFPEFPVVPGSLIIHAFLKASEEAGFSGDDLVINDFQFREFLRPGRYAFRMELREGLLHCFIRRGNRKLVTGIFKR